MDSNPNYDYRRGSLPPRALLALFGVKPPLHPGAVYGDLLRGIVVGNGQTALALCVGKETQRQIPAPADQLQLAYARQQVGRFEVDLFAAKGAQLVQWLLDEPVIAHSQLTRKRQTARPVLLVGGIGRVGCQSICPKR